MAEFASKGVAGTGLGLGIAGTALGILNGGTSLLNGVGANTINCSENVPVNRYELDQQSRISKLESDIALRDANTYNDQKLLEVYKYFDGKLNCINDTLTAQAVYNATNTATIGCVQNQVNQLASLTKLVVPNSSVCPGWGDVTITPSTSTTT